MFSTKQSDIFYNDETKEMFVCKVSAISAERCEGSDEVVYGALPLVYKINKADNYKTLVYPKNLNTIQTDPNSDLYNLTPTCPTSGTNFDSITKPLINYPKTPPPWDSTAAARSRGGMPKKSAPKPNSIWPWSILPFTAERMWISAPPMRCSFD